MASVPPGPLLPCLALLRETGAMISLGSVLNWVCFLQDLYPGICIDNKDLTRKTGSFFP